MPNIRFPEDSEAEVAGGGVFHTREADKAGGASSPSGLGSGAVAAQGEGAAASRRSKRSHGTMSAMSGADLAAGGIRATGGTCADAGAGIGGIGSIGSIGMAHLDHRDHPMGSEPEGPEGEAPKREKRARMGAIASAAAEQWGLDLETLELWAERRHLPGVGLTDLLDYRRDHPEEDLSAGLTSIPVE